MVRIPVTSIAPDLRFGLVDGFAPAGGLPRPGGVLVTGCLHGMAGVPAYLRYSDREAEISVPDVVEVAEVEQELIRRLRMRAESGLIDDLSLAVIALDAVDRCFREAGLWRGNIYLAGSRALARVLSLVGVEGSEYRDPVEVMRELAALELAYLFPIAGKFRAGAYDGQVQYRLNGWGRSLAGRLVAGRAGGSCARDLRRGIGDHLAAEEWRYGLFLRELDVARQDYDGDVLDAALGLPIPVLV